MSDNNFEKVHWTLMNEYLPIGLAIFNKAKTGGIKSILDTLKKDETPLEDLMHEGEKAARDVRERLDSLSSGLGNPITSVDISVETNEQGVPTQEYQSLELFLERLEIRLKKLGKHMENDETEEPNIVTR